MVRSNFFLSTKIQVWPYMPNIVSKFRFINFETTAKGVKKKLENRFKQIFRTPLHSQCYFDVHSKQL